MTKKRRRKRPAPLRPAETSAPAAPPEPPAGRARTALPRGERRPAPRTRATERPAPTRRPRTAEERRAAAAQWVHPPVAVTAARGLWAVGESPVLVISSFLAALAMWLVFTAYGAHLARYPGLMAMLEALPPVHSLFLDISALVGGSTGSGMVALAFLAGLLAIRAALGASRARLIRQALTESLLLGLLGGMVGCGLAYWLLRLLVAIAPDGIPRLPQASLDLRVLLFTLAGSLLSGVLFGLAPAFQSPRPEVLAGSRTLGSGRSLFRPFLVTAQIAVSLILLTAASLLLRTLWNLQNVPLGLQTESILK